MKTEPKVKQVWTVVDVDEPCEIKATYLDWVWALPKGSPYVCTFHKDDLDTMIVDEHGKEIVHDMSEDNDDVVFYDVVKGDENGPHLNVQLAGHNPCSITRALYREDLDGRTCVGFLYEHTGKANQYFSVLPLYSECWPFAESDGDVKKIITDAVFKVPVKAVFKRLEVEK